MPITRKTTTLSKPKPSYHWRCSKCGRTADSSVKPSMTYGGNCPKATNGMHRWMKER